MPYYHISYHGDLKCLSPKVPECASISFEDKITKRVCACDTIDGCLSALMPCVNKNRKLYVYKIITDMKPYIPNIKDVRDCKETGEVWFLDTVDVQLEYIINNVKEVESIKCKNYKGTFSLHKYTYNILLERENVLKIRKLEMEDIEKYGYYKHLVLNDSFKNIHTHGLLKSFGIIEMQICILDDEDLANELLESVIHSAIKGETHLVDGDILKVHLLDETVYKLEVKLLKDKFGMYVYRLINLSKPYNKQISNKELEINSKLINY